MLIMGDKSCKKFRAREEIKVLSFGSATGVPHLISAKSLHPGFPSASPTAVLKQNQ